MVTLSGDSSIVFLTHFLPLVPGFADHAGDQVDVDLIEPEIARPGVGAIDFVGEMGSAVGFQNLVVEVLDAQAQARDAQVA